MRSRAAVAVAVLALAVASGCTGAQAPGVLPGPAKIDVDTPELRSAKADAGIADCPPGPADAAPVADGLPAVSLPCLGGGSDVELSALRGPMVVNLWAAWCGPCRRELPIYQQFYAAHGDAVPVLGIDFNDPQPLGALRLARDAGVTYPLVADPQADLAGPRPGLVPRGLPMLALVDERGAVVMLVPKEVTSLSELEDLVRDKLGVEL